MSEIFLVAAGERREPREKLKKNSAKRPDIRLETVLLSVHYFRSHVERSSTLRFRHVFLFEGLREPEVCNSDFNRRRREVYLFEKSLSLLLLAVLLWKMEQYVGELDVPVDGTALEEVVETVDDLRGENACTSLIDAFAQLDKVVEVATVAELKEDVVVVRGFLQVD